MADVSRSTDGAAEDGAEGSWWVVAVLVIWDPRRSWSGGDHCLSVIVACTTNSSVAIHC